MKRNSITGFKTNFNILDYADIIPALPERIEDIINWDLPTEKCVWHKKEPKEITAEYKDKEVERVLKTGVWIFINQQPVWIPPNYYFFLQYGVAGGESPKFRLKRLKHVYFKIRIRNNPRAIGTYTIKNRQDGETTMSIHDSLWECMIGNMTVGQIGIQSKTNSDAFNPCWTTLQALWQTIPGWLKEIVFSDFASKGAIAEKIKFERAASEGHSARHIIMAFYPSVHNAMDGKNNMRKCILDEVNKWRECSFYDTYINYKKFIAVGSSRRGLFDIFSSPADTNGKWNDEALIFWKGSNPYQLTETGSTATRVFRYYSNPLDGIEGFYDEFGDADADDILRFIMQERKSLPKDKLLAEVRAFPLNEDEMFGSYESGNIWDNAQGIKDRVIFLTGIRFKNDATKEPVCIYGNLERIDGYIDGDVEFRTSDKTYFDVYDARFCFTFLPQNVEALKNIFYPPNYVERCIGIDPFNNRYEAKNVVKQSNGAMVGRQFLDVHETGVLNVPFMSYCNRPQHQETFFEDCIKAAIFNRAFLQVESKSDKLANYCEDRGYFAWLLAEIGASADSKRKGDAPSGGKNAFLNEGIGLINANTNVPNPLNPQPYWLENTWDINILHDYLAFNPLDTHANDLTMADIQAHVGCIKMLHKKVREYSRFNDVAMDYLLN